MAPVLYALDQNFPQPIVNALTRFQVHAELVPVWQIDERMSDLDDWELLLALHHHERPWAGLITTDRSMLSQARELATLMKTHLTLVVAMASVTTRSGRQGWSSRIWATSPTAPTRGAHRSSRCARRIARPRIPGRTSSARSPASRDESRRRSTSRRRRVKTSSHETRSTADLMSTLTR